MRNGIAHTNHLEIIQTRMFC